ncbi:phage protein NinX family protein [Escherichia coli]
MDYSQLSDFEINCEVLAVFEPDVNHMCLSESKGYFYDCGPVGDGWHQIDIPDYCNNPEDAEPIIVENRIGIIPAPENGLWKAAHRKVGSDSTPYHMTQDENPLRAAMIVFLMMQDANNA